MRLFLLKIGKVGNQVWFERSKKQISKYQNITINEKVEIINKTIIESCTIKFWKTTLWKSIRENSVIMQNPIMNLYFLKELKHKIVFVNGKEKIFHLIEIEEIVKCINKQYLWKLLPIKTGVKLL